MKYMLDTNICIYLIKNKPVEVLKNFQKIHISDVAISAITLSELEYGVEKSSNREKNKLALLEFTTPFTICAYTEEAAVEYGILRTTLERNGKCIGAMDMLIAAHALSLGLTLVSNNLREFKRIPGLKLDNWVK